LQGNETFWSFHDLIFKNQEALGGGSISTQLHGLAASIPGLDLVEYERCLAEERSAPVVSSDIDFARRNSIGTVPTLFINAFRITGTRDVEEIRSIIRQVSRQQTLADPLQGDVNGSASRIDSLKTTP